MDRSDDGWWKGVCEGRVGWFPETYVEPVAMETRADLARESLTLSTSQPATMEETMKTGEYYNKSGRDHQCNNVTVIYAHNTLTGGDLEVVEYRCIFPYHSETEGDLTLAEGDTVLVYWAQDNGWWYGAIGVAQGWFPGSFVEVRHCCLMAF